MKLCKTTVLLVLCSCVLVSRARGELDVRPAGSSGVISGGQVAWYTAGAAVTLPTPSPDYDWWYGCSPTSAGMMMGHYDIYGYNGRTYRNLVLGGTAETDTFGNPGARVNSAIASIEHISDFYAGGYLASGDDAFGAPNHSFNCLADFMGTSQDAVGNVNGSTTFWFYTNGAKFTYQNALGHGVQDQSGMYGIYEYITYAGYGVTSLYNQYTDNLGNSYGFSFADYMAEIDAGRAVMIHVEGHSMYGYGYDAATSKVLLHDTWYRGEDMMTWGGSYSGLAMYGVTILELTGGDEVSPDVPEPVSLVVWGTLACIGTIAGFQRRSTKRDRSWVSGRE